MKNIFEGDNWILKGEKINSKTNLERVQECLENIGPIILQHWYYRGSRSPDRMCFDDFVEFHEYLSKQVSPGDIIEIWSMESVCKKENVFIQGKYPDDQGRVPEKGAY